MKAFVLPGDDPEFKQRVDAHKYLQVGMIVRVDNELNQVDIAFTSNPGTSFNVPITSPFFTGRSLIGGMPEVGSYVVCGFVQSMGDVGTPVILAYMDPFYQRSLGYSYSDGKAPSDMQEVGSVRDKIGYGIVRLKRRKQYPGDIALESTQGSNLLLDDDVRISDSNLNEIVVSSADNSITMSSVINALHSSGIRILSGLVMRPGAPLVESITAADGAQRTIITDNDNTVDTNGRPFSEFRIDVQEIPTGSPPNLDSLEDQDFAIDGDDRAPLLTQVMGTLIGNSRQDLLRYGRVLRPQVFTDANDSAAHVDDVVCMPSEYTTIAGAFQLKFKSGTKIDVDKEGHMFVNVAASSGRHPLGSGRSLEMFLAGSAKVVLGRELNGGISLDLDTVGMIDVHVGHDVQDLASLRLNLERSMSISVSAPDRLGMALTESYVGNVKQDVRGNKDVTVSGNYTVTVQGKIQENILGTKVENFVNDKKTSYGGSYDEIIIGRRSSVIGGLGSGVGSPGDSRTITSGGASLKILSGDLDEILTLGDRSTTLAKGDLKELLTLGNRSTTLVSGNLTETLTNGDRSTTMLNGDHSISITQGNGSITIVQGDYTVSITNGDIKISSKFGAVNVEAATNKVSIFGLSNVEVKSGGEVKVVAPAVRLGPSPAQGGVVTGLPGTPSWLDPITGAPATGSTTVSASL